MKESPQREGEPSASDEKSLQREGEPSADMKSHQQLFKQSIVGRSVESQFTSIG